MNLWKEFFSFRGRINRADFWIAVLLMVALWFAAALAQVIPIAVLGVLVGFALLVAGFVVWFVAVVRRLHDRDKSAWYLLLFFGLPSLLQGLFNKNAGTTLYLFAGGTGSFIDLLCLAISIWMIVELGFLRGTAGPNQYGPGPSATSASPASTVP